MRKSHQIAIAIAFALAILCLPKSSVAAVGDIQKPVAYQGRVVHGVTRQPMAGALVVVGIGGAMGPNVPRFADIDAAQWQLLHTLPRDRPAGPADVKSAFGRMLRVRVVMRTDDEGRFEVTWLPTDRPGGAFLIEENFVPAWLRLAYPSEGNDEKLGLGELPLFPAGKVVVCPTPPEGYREPVGKALMSPVALRDRLLVHPKWILEEDGQPAWAQEVRKLPSPGDKFGLYYQESLRNSESQPVFVPAGLKVKLRFESSNAGWSPVEQPDRVFELKQGEVANLGDVRFHRSP